MALRKSLLATAILAATVGLTGCGGSSSDNNTVTTPETPAPTTPSNKAPTITVETASVMEDTLGAEITGITIADDNDDAAALTFTVSDGRFEVVEGKLKLKATNALNFEQEADQKVSLTVTATDSAGEKVEQAIEVAITDMQPTAGKNLYAFENNGNSSVAYSGQTSRHAAMAEAKSLLGKLTTDVSVEDRNTTLTVAEGFILAQDESFHGSAFTFTEGKGVAQSNLGEISSKKTVAGEGGKIAGSDASPMNKTWNDGTSFVGWNEFGTFDKTPNGLVEYYFDLIKKQVETANSGTKIFAEHNEGSVELTKLYVTPEGLDLAQLIQKHLNGAVSLSQGADDYMDELLFNNPNGNTEITPAQNAEVDADKNYTDMEHKWDEAYGYFGAAINYLEYSDDEIAGKGGRDAFKGGYNDYDGKDGIDLKSEYNFGNSGNAAKRDRGTKSNANPTDFSAAAQIAFINGRAIINKNVGTNIDQWSSEDQAELKEYRDQALLYWEKSIAATVVHYINDTISHEDGDLKDIASGTYTADQFYAVAKHWSEMKGFALNSQFNPHSPITDEKFKEIHELMGDAPTLTAAGVDAYITNLEKARDIIAEAYKFDADNVTNW
ncbi:DUF4856 domain-containing protein [Pseudoalteromonas luteoviolacea]|uniref:DUF4856 domain-containing protein n=1 Tax=Pseudoalteromonas luteoviolacea TaxID=43657 RepID=UPI001B381E3C|nr:DUF4856 domain-containing protein [Pseudoalteromonas luteoviolacea]MBQ4836107.1 DUF4856 domain-containing protein [Pseudoalteromonas luteoviolacea]